MTDTTQDGSMHMRRALRQQLISRDTALLICRRIIAEIDGQDVLTQHEPLRVEDGGDVWHVRGGFETKPELGPFDPVPVHMAISKFDGKILSLTGSTPSAGIAPAFKGGASQ